MRNRWMLWCGAAVFGAVIGSLPTSAAFAQDDCKNRGQLDTLYCDENNDLVADAPKDPKKHRDPGTLVFAYTPVEDPAVYGPIFKPFSDYLAQCTGKRVIYYPVNSNAAEIEAMRSGRLHFAGFSTGPTGFAVNLAGAVPFAAKGTERGPQGYHLLAIVKASSPYQKLSDLKGKRVAHTAPSSNSGHLAPLVLYPPEGLKPNDDYKPLMSGGHDKSILGVAHGDYDMPDGSWQFDYTVFDRYVEFAMSCGISKQINCYSMLTWSGSLEYTDAATGDTLYSHNAGKLFMPASNQKLLTGATALAQLVSAYLQAHDPADPWVSPLFGELKGLPPVLLHVGTDEVLRDDSLRFAQKAQRAGVNARVQIWPGVPHVWQLLWRLPEAQRSITQASEFLANAQPWSAHAPEEPDRPRQGADVSHLR